MATKLTGGHQDSILVLSTNSENKIFSGDGIGKLVIWTPDGSAVMSRNFDSGGVNSICASKLNTNILYVANGCKVFVCDMRNIAEVVTTFEVNNEEINQLALHENEKFLASCDDSGKIKVLNLEEGEVFKTLNKHDNICSTVAFRPARPWEMFSASYDCCLLHWDFSRGRFKNKIDMNDLPPAEPIPGQAFLLNPPFIHSISVSANGNYLACGCENSQLQIFDCSKRNIKYLTTLLGHSQGVSQVHFATDSLLVSGGNDGQVIFWDLQQPADDHGGLLLKRTVTHRAKINWITSSSSENKVLIADSSCDITVYTLTQ